jgi:hypothetical protein
MNDEQIEQQAAQAVWLLGECERLRVQLAEAERARDELKQKYECQTPERGGPYCGASNACYECFRKFAFENETEVERLEQAIGALGVIGGGYCFCSSNRDPEKTEHEPECRDLRQVLAETKS